MKLRGIDFGNVFGASGVQGFFGEGYWFHNLWRPFGLNFTDATFVAKTATLLPRKGNMPLTSHYTPKDLFPRCVRVRLGRGAVLNSVGLSNPGINALLNTGNWQKRTKPFLISIGSTAETPSGRLEEFRIMIQVIGAWKDSFSAPFGLEVDLSCPNIGHDPRRLIDESAKILETIDILGVPLIPKYDIVSAPLWHILQLNDYPHCDAICVSNTLPFGSCDIDWRSAWGSTISPLAKLGGGGLSGKTLCPLVCQWITHLRGAGFTKPINGGGGILCPQDVESYHIAGASSIFLGSVAVLRPWRVKKIIRRANSLNW